MLYRLIKSIIRFLLAQFFKKIAVIGEPAVADKPLLVVANHPNHMLDSLLVGHCFKRPLWFVAKSTLFSNPVSRWFLAQLHILPLQRKQDHAPGTRLDNKKTFEKVAAALNSGKAVVIFPEGTSKGERRLSEIKTGAARMVMQAQEEADFLSELVIQPIGITYNHFDLFGSSVTLNIGTPIETSRFKNDYHRDSRETVREITERIDTAISELTVEVAAEDEASLVEQIATLYNTENHGDNDFERMKLIAQNLEALSPNFPEKRDRIERQLRYLNDTDALHMESARGSLIKILISPFVLLGVLALWLPYRFIGVLIKRHVHDPVVVGSHKLTLGTFIFSGWYIVLFAIVALLTHSLKSALILIVLLFLSGLAANRYWFEIKPDLMAAIPGLGSRVQRIRKMRRELINELEELRVV